jgi:hypothetical protein
MIHVGRYVCLPLGYLGIFTTTLLGWITVSQIRRSRGGLYGLGLAVFNGLVFPLLALDGVLIFLGLMGARVVADDFRHLNGSLFRNLWDTSLWFLLMAAVLAWVNTKIVSRVWRAVRPDGATKSAQTSGWGRLMLYLSPLAAFAVLLAVWSMGSPSDTRISDHRVSKTDSQTATQAADDSYPGDWIWEPNSDTLDRVPPIFLLRPTAFPTNYVPFGMMGKDRYLARRQTVKELIKTFWSQKNSSLPIIFDTTLPDDKFDFIVTSESHWSDHLESEVDQRFDLSEHIESRDGRDVVVVTKATKPQSDLTDRQPPVVVETWPVSGAKDVAPGEADIRVRFSKPMMDGSWSWSTAWENSAPEFIGTPHYEADGCTCVVKVKLEPGQTYAFWLNSEKFTNFRDRAGLPAVPYLLIFQTKSN